MEFRLTDAAIRRQVNRSAATIAAIYAVGLVAVTAYTRSALFAAVAFAFAVIGVVLSRRRMRNLLTRYVLIVSDDSISMPAPMVLAPAEMARSEVASIEEREGLGLAVRDSRRRCIGVPAGIENYEQVRDLLRSWQPIELKPRSHARLWSVAASVAIVAGFAAAILSDDPRIIIPIGVAVAMALLLSIVLVMRSPLVGAKMKRSMLFCLLPLIAIVARIVQVISQ